MSYDSRKSDFKEMSSFPEWVLYWWFELTPRVRVHWDIPVSWRTSLAELFEICWTQRNAIIEISSDLEQLSSGNLSSQTLTIWWRVLVQMWNIWPLGVCTRGIHFQFVWIFLYWVAEWGVHWMVKFLAYGGTHSLGDVGQSIASSIEESGFFWQIIHFEWESIYAEYCNVILYSYCRERAFNDISGSLSS